MRIILSTGTSNGTNSRPVRMLSGYMSIGTKKKLLPEDVLPKWYPTIVLCLVISSLRPLNTDFFILYHI